MAVATIKPPPGSAARSAGLNAKYGLGAAPKKAPVKTPGKKPPATTPTAPSTTDPFGDLVSTASQQAKDQIAAEIAAITGQQQQELANARDQAKQLSLASLAGANLIHGFGTPVADAYQEAAKTLAALGAGYTGTLRSDAAAEAARAAHDIAVGATAQGSNSVPGPGTIAPPPVVNHAEDIANFLYGKDAAQPGGALASAGAAAAAREAALPTSIIGYGQDLGVGSLAAARKAVDALAPQIGTIAAKFPALQASILSGLANAQGKLEKANTPRIIGSSSSGYYSVDPRTGALTQVLGPTASTRVQTFSSGGNEYAINPDGTVQQITHNQPSGPALKAVKTKNGTALVDPRTGRTVRTIPGTVGVGGSGPKAPTPNELNQMVQSFKNGGLTRVTIQPTNAAGQPATDKNGNPVYKTITKRTGKLGFQQAYNRLRALHVTDVDARHLLASAYKRGEQGRGWLTNEEQAVLKSQRGLVPHAHRYKGVGFLDRGQAAVLQRLGLLPPGSWQDGGHTSTQDFGTVYVIDQTYN